MKKILFLLLFVAAYSITYSQVENIPYTIQFRGAYGTSVNSGKSYLYVNPANGNLRADGVLPKKEDINYSNYEWYFIPIEGGEPGWYYVKNGSGKLLYNNGNNVITVGEPGEGHYPEWRFFKTHIYTTAEQEYNFRMVQYVKEKACHMIRSGNSFITTNNSFTTANTTLLIKPADDYYLHNNDMELITNYEPYKVSSSISLDPPFLMDPDSSQCIINSYYFPANFKRLGSSGSLLMYDPSDRNSYYFIRMKQNDSIRTFFSHKKDTEDELVNYKINVKVRSSQIDQSPASLRVINQANDEYQEYALYVKKTDEWYDYQFYISLKNFDNDPYIDIYTSLDRKDSYIDIDDISIERVDIIPEKEDAFLPGEYNSTGSPLFDYPYDNPAFTYTVRTSISSIIENKAVFIPIHFFKEYRSLNIIITKINGIEIDSLAVENITVDEKGIYLQAENLFDAGNEYELDISVNSGGNIYAQNVNVKVVPEEVFWQPEEGLEELSWNYDINWKDKKGKQAFIPLKSTNVVLKSDQNTYPLLSSPESEAGKTPFIEYDYNFQPNACSEILFEKGSELGNPYFLDYNTAQIEWEINTLQWYNMSPPLKNMYSGDFMFDRLNPLSELQMHNVKNPQTGFYSTDWTHSFNNTNVLLNAGQGYNLRVGNLYYTQITENGADFSSETTLDKVVYKFPDSRYSFQFYDEIIKETSDRIEYIPEDGRDFSNRFIYESIRNEECVVPEGDILFKRDLPVSDGEAPVVIGNPFMSHFDFEMFYLYNYQSILPEFKLLNSDGDYETVLGIDEDHNGMINKYVSTNESIGLYSIQPMQSFIVTTRENYAGQPLIFNKFMSRLKTKNSGERDNSEDILFIRLEENAKTLSKAVVYFPEKEESSAAARRSSRKMINEQTKEPAHIFTVSDDKFLDVNSLNNENEIEIGIIASENNDIHLIIDNLSSFRLKDEWYLYDRETNTHISFVNKEKVVYPFKRTNQEVNNRFCIKRNFNSLSDLENRNKIEVSVNDEFIYITSDKNDPIQSVVISGIDGRKIGKHTYRNISQVDIKHSISKNSICLITVNTYNQVKTFKTLIK